MSSSTWWRPRAPLMTDAPSGSQVKSSALIIPSVSVVSGSKQTSTSQALTKACSSAAPL